MPAGDGVLRIPKFEALVSIAECGSRFSVDSKRWFRFHRVHMIDFPVKTSADIGKIIRRVRRNQGIRQDDLPAYIDSSHVFLRDVEKGKPSVQIGRVLRALDELGIKVTLHVPDAFLIPRKRRPER